MAAKSLKITDKARLSVVVVALSLIRNSYLNRVSGVHSLIVIVVGLTQIVSEEHNITYCVCFMLFGWRNSARNRGLISVTFVILSCFCADDSCDLSTSVGDVRGGRLGALQASTAVLSYVFVCAVFD